jgi:flagellar hook-associated protein 2
MGLSAGGTYLDINTIVTQLMSVERAPLTAIEKKQSTTQTKVSAYGTVKSALSSFQTAASNLSSLSSFQKVSATSSGTGIVVSANANAAAGSYNIEVKQLAQAQKLATQGQSSSQEAIGSGTITFDFGTITNGTKNSDGKYSGATFTSSGGDLKTVKVDPSNTSLSGIRDAINNAKIGVSATIVNDGGTTPFRLVLTDSATGKAGSMKISTSGDPALGSLLNHNPEDADGQALSETKTAQDAIFTVDGLTVSKSTNTVTDAIDGVTLNLKTTTDAASGGVTIDVASDIAAMAASVNQFVTSYNQLNKTLRDITAYNPDTKVAAALNGDATIRGIQSQIRSVMATPISNGKSLLTSLSQVGVKLQSGGVLAANATKLNEALTSDAKGVAGLFATVGSTTDALTSYVGSTSDTQVGDYSVNVSRLATQGTLTSSTPPGLTVVAGENDTLSFLINGTAADITLSEGTYTADSLTKELQSKINGSNNLSKSGITVSVFLESGNLSITSKTFGSKSSVQLTGGMDPSYFFGAYASLDGKDVAGTINGVAAVGSGQSLTGAKGDKSEGLRVSIKGNTGDRGSVSFTKGYAAQLSNLLSKMLADDGAIKSRTDGLSTTLKTLDKSSASLNTRLSTLQDKYFKQYSTLDSMLGNLQATNSALSQQLAAISANY